MRRKLVATAAAEVGYLEKASPDHLDSKTANAGDGNYTKYWRDMYPPFQGQPWCDCFVDWCFFQAFGAEASRLECGGDREYYTPTSAMRYKEKGRWSEDPEVGAQIFFRNGQRICHTGIVESYSYSHVVTIEGNATENGKSGVWRKTYLRNDPHIAGYGIPDYRGDKMIYTTPDTFIKKNKEAYDYERRVGAQYGDSHSLPPCHDSPIPYMSCDRGCFALPCWWLGWTDQPAGGVTTFTILDYAKKWGWSVIRDQEDLQAGDVVVMQENGHPTPDEFWHVFTLTDYNPETGICSKYDFGSGERLVSAQPFRNVPLNQWRGRRTFFCGLRCPQKPRDVTRYRIDAAPWKEGNRNYSVLLGRALLKARGYKGENRKMLELTMEADADAIHAMMNFKRAARLPLDSKAFNRATLRAAVRMPVDDKCKFVVEAWGEGDTGASVYLAQMILKANGYRGADGKILALDGIAGGNTMHALVSYKKDRGIGDTRACKLRTWQALTRLPTKQL